MRCLHLPAIAAPGILTHSGGDIAARHRIQNDTQLPNNRRIVTPVAANEPGLVLTLPQHLRLSHSHSAVNLNKAYVPSLDARSSTFVGRPLRADPFDGGPAKSKDSRKCVTCSFRPAFV
jgi:hypothetical protein